MSQTFHSVFMICGPNGVGETTAAMVLSPKFLDVFEFVNADEIAYGLNPVKPEPEAVIRRRYVAGLKNLVNCYLQVVDTALMLDNSNVLAGDKGQIIDITAKE